MRAGLTTSVILHAAALAFGLLSLSAPAALPPMDESVAVEIVPMADVATVQQGDKKAVMRDKPAPTPTQRPDVVADAQKVGDNSVDTDKPPTPEAKPIPVDTANAPPPAPTPTEKPAVEDVPKPKEDPKPVPATEIAPVPQPKQEVKPEPVKAPEPKPQPKLDPIKVAETKPDPKPEPKPDPKPEPVKQPDPAPQPKPEPKAEAKPQPEVKPDAVAQAIDTAPPTEAAPDPVPAPDVVQLPKSAPAPNSRPQPQTAKADTTEADAAKADTAKADSAKAETAQAESAKAPDRKNSDKPVKEASSKAKSDEKAFNADDIAALLDKQKPSGGGAKRSTQQASLGGDKSTGNKLSQTEMDGLRQKLSGCWSIPAGVDDAEMLKVTVRFHLDRSGMLDGRPEIIKGGAASGPGRTAAESAVRAVQKCAPFNLAADKYDSWSEVVVNFDPSDMF